MELPPLVADDEEDEQEVADRKTYERYEEAMDAVMAAFGRGVTPSSELYAARDLQLYRLSDSDLQAEYARYTAMYLNDDTSSAVRGMCEMSLIKMGEMVDKPQARRIQMVARQAEKRSERGGAQAGEALGAKERAERTRQTR